MIKPGPLALIQDLGRPGYGHLGVPRSGAADEASLRLANRLAGNPDGAAGIELTFGRAAFRFRGAAVVAVAGAPAPVTLEPWPDAAAHGADPGTASDVPHGEPFEVPDGGVVRVGAPPAGLRSYLAVRGGIDVPPVLGSRSADRLSGLGPEPVRPGDRLPLGRPRSPRETPRGDEQDTSRSAAGTGPVTLRVLAGPRDDWFAAAAQETLATAEYEVTAASDRTGLRLAGPPLARSAGRPGELPSEGVATGSLQVTHDGLPILLLADHPTTGGYPVIAVVLSADLGLAAQLRPGQRVRFEVRAAGLL